MNSFQVNPISGYRGGMPWVDHPSKFRDEIESAGLCPPTDIVTDGQFHRFAPDGRRGDSAGWYTYHEDDIPHGAFGNWRTGLTKSWRGNIGRPLTLDEEEAYRKRRLVIRRQRELERAKWMAEAKQKARSIWEGASEASPSYPYLQKKFVKPYGLRAYGESLIIPLMDGAGLQSLQFIDSDGTKRFLQGGRVKGCHFMLGMPGSTVCIAEGFATAASIHEATGYAVAVAFNAANLLSVAESLRAQYPSQRLIICADDDFRTEGNPGITRGREAAEAAGGSLAVPDFGPDRPDTATDFNDLHRHRDLEAVRTAIEHAQSIESMHAEVTESWTPPKPIVGELKPVPTFDAAALLPDVLRAWVMDEAERMPCPPEYVAVAALVALGSVIGARCVIKPKSKDAWSVVPNLWGGIVGEPSAKKSPAWGVAMRPLNELIARARDAQADKLADYEMAKVVFSAKKAAIEARIREAAKKDDKGDPAAIAHELREHELNEPEAPVLRRYKTNDTTVEKLGELLQENPAGLLVVRDELVGLLASWDREGHEGDRAFFLEAWNGNQAFDTDRIARGHISIPNLCVSIFGGIQPDKLTGYLEQSVNALANDGMLQRFQLLVYPDSVPWEWRDRSPDKAAGDAALAIFEKLAEFNPTDWGAASADEHVKSPFFRFDNAAQAVFIEWSNGLHLVRMENECERIMQQHLAKFDKLFPALALIFHLVDCAAHGVCGPVTREAARRAAAWCDFLEFHARRCYGLLKDNGLRAAQALATKLERGALPDGFTLRDIRRHQWSSLTKDREIQAALDWLEDDHWLRAESVGGTGPGSGRRTVRYRINPALRKGG